MKGVLIGLMVMIGAVALRGAPDRDAYVESFERSWAAFEKACVAGDVKSIEAQCGRRLIGTLEGSSLSIRLGEQWRAEGVSLKRKVIIVPHRPHEAAAFVILEVTEQGEKKLQVMSWVFTDGAWKCLNLPFDNTLLPPAMKYPPLWCERDAG